MGFFSGLSKVLDSAESGFIKKALTGAGMTVLSNTVLLTLFNVFLDQFRDHLGNINSPVLALLHMSGVDLALSIVLSAIATRMALDSTGFKLGLKR